jgi:hypothetical protein
MSMGTYRKIFKYGGKYSEGLGDAHDFVEGLEVGVHDDSGVHVALEEALHGCHDFSRQNDHRGGPVAYLLVLGTGQLDHALRRRVRHINLKFKLKTLLATSLRMALPSLVRTMPPIGSRSILSMDLGPRVVRTMSLTA